MKKYVSLLSILFLHAPLSAEIGCMDNSLHMSSSYDYKTYQYVSCNCPCKKYKHYWHRGYRCSKCEHAHDPKIATFMRSRYSANGVPKYLEHHKTVLSTLAKNIKRD